MQILVLDSCPRKAVRRFRSRKLPGKLLVEAMQLLGKALREHGYTDAELYNAHSASHPCCIWVTSGKDAFKWTLAHARELHTVFDLYVRKRCAKCSGYTGTPHGSLKALEFLERLVARGGLPSTMPDSVDASEFYATVEAIRARQGNAAIKKAGAVIRAAEGLPTGCSSMALAIDAEHQSTCIRTGAIGGVDGVESYRSYHELKVPVVIPGDCPWMDGDDAAVPTHVCACVKRKRKSAPVLVCDHL